MFAFVKILKYYNKKKQNLQAFVLMHIAILIYRYIFFLSKNFTEPIFTATFFNI